MVSEREKATAGNGGEPEIDRSESDSGPWGAAYVEMVVDLACMASIAGMLFEGAFDDDRAIERNGDVLTFRFSKAWVDDMSFMVRDLANRSAALRGHSIADPRAA